MSETARTLSGPNMRRLAVHRMALDAVPAGGGFADAIRFMSSKDRIVSSAKAAEEWARAAVDAIRNAADPNPWRDADDEAIAGEILRGVAARKSAARS